MDTITAASKALFGNYTVQEQQNQNSDPHAAPRTTETNTLDNGLGHNTMTGSNTTDPSYTHRSNDTTGASNYGTSHSMTSSSTNAGPHNSNLSNKVDPRVDSDLDGSRTATGATHGAGGYGAGNMSSTTAGPHNSNLANKVDPRVDSDLDGSRTATGATHGAGGYGAGNMSSTTAGPHSSNLANKVDPRVDSDLDGSRTATGTTHGAGGYGAGNMSSTTAGPHSSNLANKVDPRVDSDRDGSRMSGNTTGAGSYGAGNMSSATAGPHSSNLANKADPRVDSDLDGSRTATGATHHGAGGSAVGGRGDYTSTTGTGYGSSTTAGPHNSNLANKVDPRVDSDRDGRTTGNATYGSSTGMHTSGAGYPTSTNAGPHDSNLANKVDPRVDSDRSRITDHTSSANPGLTGATGTATGIGSDSIHRSQEHSNVHLHRAPEHPPNTGPMTGSHSHRGSGQFTATQDTHDTLHRRDHADGANHTRNEDDKPTMDGKGTPGAMPEIIKKGLEELRASK